MAVIKREILQRITNEVTELKFQKKLTAVNLRIRKAVQSIIRKSEDGLKFPKELIEAKYIGIATSVSIKIPCRRWSSSVTVDPYPCKQNSIYCMEHNDTPQLEKACQALKKLEDDKDTYQCKFRQTLFALKTDKRIIDNLPELESYLIKHKITPPLAENAIIPVSLINEMRNDIKTLQLKEKR